jgi:uncharacterized protein
VDASRRARADKTIKGLGAMRKTDPDRAERLADMIVKNTYRTLMTRGMKGCFVYCVDPALREYLRSRLRIEQAAELPMPTLRPTSSNVIPLRRVSAQEKASGIPCAPFIDLRIAAGGFSSAKAVEDLASEWAALPDFVQPQPDLFVAQVTGESMNRRIPNGAWCLFRANPQGTRQGKIVVVQHRGIEDPETGASFTIKRYRSEKASSAEGSWSHERIVLKPESDDSRFQDIVIEAAEEQEFRVVAEFLMVLAE